MNAPRDISRSPSVKPCLWADGTFHLCLGLSLQDVEIRTNAALYLPQISELLNRVPRQMLLLLKTNDLLRGIETTLETRASSSSFINMSRCCVRALARSVTLLTVNHAGLDRSSSDYVRTPPSPLFRTKPASLTAQ